MQKKLKIFSSDVFGDIRVININSEPWFVGNDVANILGYGNPRQGIASHVDDEDKGVQKLDTPSGKQNFTIINESGLYSLILSSKLPTAKKFKHWVTSEVLPSIRKTGSYTAKPLDESKTKRLAIMERNAKVREAALWAKLAEGSSGTYQQVCKAYAANTLAEKDVVSLPKAEEKTYTATEVGNMLGVSAHKVGRLANIHRLKTPEYGSWYHDKAKHSGKEVETFRYNAKAVDKFRQILHSVITDKETSDLVGDVVLETK